MANLIKINYVYLFTSYHISLVECTIGKDILSTAGIIFTEADYRQEDVAMTQLCTLSTWGWGREGIHKTLNQYPVLMWREHYDDGVVVDQVACGIQEISTASLLSNKNLIE